MSVPTPILVGGELKYSIHFLMVLRALYFLDFCAHASKAARPAPAVATYVAMPTRLYCSQSTSPFGITASAAAASSSASSASSTAPAAPLLLLFFLPSAVAP